MKTDILILPSWDLQVHTPQDPTYGIGIDSNLFRDVYVPPEGNTNWLKFRTYKFDHTAPSDAVDDREIIFDEELARRVIIDFSSYVSRTTVLIGSCYQGANRSPGLIIPCNDIFDLGHDTEELLSRYPHYDQHVFDTMMMTSEKMKREGLI